MKHLAVMFGMILFLCGCMAPSVVAQPPPSDVGAFDACVQAGYELIRTYPTRCITPDGRVFIKEQPIKNNNGSLCKDLCGDGICQQMVCMGEGCPCAETPINCAPDCVVRD